MKPFLSDWTIVIAGLWNVRIFTPEWIAQHLLKNPQSKIEIEIPVKSGFPLRFRSEHLTLIPQPSRIVIGMDSIQDNVLNEAETLGKKIMGLLPHTPMSAFGINFGFSQEDPQIADLFNTNDIEKLSSNGIERHGTEIIHKLKQDVGELNLKLSMFWPESKKLAGNT